MKNVLGHGMFPPLHAHLFYAPAPKPNNETQPAAANSAGGAWGNIRGWFGGGGATTNVKQSTPSKKPAPANNNADHHAVRPRLGHLRG